MGAYSSDVGQINFNTKRIPFGLSAGDILQFG